jgi:hypothetical protein
MARKLEEAGTFPGKMRRIKTTNVSSCRISAIGDLCPRSYCKRKMTVMVKRHRPFEHFDTKKNIMLPVSVISQELLVYAVTSVS